MGSSWEMNGQWVENGWTIDGQCVENGCVYARKSGKRVCVYVFVVAAACVAALARAVKLSVAMLLRQQRKSGRGLRTAVSDHPLVRRSKAGGSAKTKCCAAPATIRGEGFADSFRRFLRTFSQSPRRVKKQVFLGGAHSGQHPLHHLHHPHPWRALMQMMQVMQGMLGMLPTPVKGHVGK